MKTSAGLLQYWFLLFLVLGECQSLGDGQPNGFESFASYMGASSSQVLNLADAQPLDSRADIDRFILEFENKMTQVTHLTETPPPIHWSDSQQSQAHPLAGIILNRKELNRIQERLNGESFRILLSFVIAHETAHMRQFTEYDSAFFANVNNTRAKELQADILASAVVMTVSIEDGKIAHARGVPGKIEPLIGSTNFLLNLGLAIGHPVWDNLRFHPTAEQRTVGSTLGFLGAQQISTGGYYNFLMKQGKVDQAEGILKDFLKWERRDPFMPVLNTNTLVMERAFPWSRRVTLTMLTPGFNYGEEVIQYKKRHGTDCSLEEFLKQ